MKTLLKNGKVINVFTSEILEQNVLIENKTIIGVGDYSDSDADKVIDVKGNFLSPGFIDGHIHIESTMLSPYEFTNVALPHGTTAVIADPHEIANVCGVDGIEYMLEASEGLPLDFYIMAPSCVPATGFDESFEEIDATKLKPLFKKKRILGLAELMNYVGAIYDDKNVVAKIDVAKKANKLIDGHAPMLTGKQLDKYVNYGINSDHECSSYEEAKERIRKGQWLMIRRGTAAKNLHDLLSLFDGPERNRCLLVTDDKEPSDLIRSGHIDSNIRKSIEKGKDPVIGITMATINAANCFKLDKVGAIAPGYVADILVIDDLENVHVKDVFKEGKLVVENGNVLPFKKPIINKEIELKITDSMNSKELKEKDFYIEPKSNKCRVIQVLPYQLVTNEVILDIDFSKNNGIDLKRDILKIAVIERHKNTGHIGLGFIQGIKLESGAIASTISHDSHNIIVIGTSDYDMMVASNRIREIGGGNVVVNDGEVVKEFALPIAGLMSDKSAKDVATLCEDTRNYVHKMGVPENIAPFMSMAFVSLPVIPTLKLTTLGLVDVNQFKLVDLFV